MQFAATIVSEGTGLQPPTSPLDATKVHTGSLTWISQTWSWFNLMILDEKWSISLFPVCVEAQYLDVIVDASWQDLVTGVIECHGQHLIGVLESVDRPFLTDVPQLPQRQTHRLINKKIINLQSTAYYWEQWVCWGLPTLEPNDVGLDQFIWFN